MNRRHSSAPEPYTMPADPEPVEALRAELIRLRYERAVLIQALQSAGVAVCSLGEQEAC